MGGIPSVMETTLRSVEGFFFPVTWTKNDRLGGNMKHTKFYYLCRAAYRRRHDDTETISGMGSAGADSGLRAWEATMVLQQARSVLSERLMAGMYSGKLIFFLLLKS